MSCHGVVVESSPRPMRQTRMGNCGWVMGDGGMDVKHVDDDVLVLVLV